MAELHKDVREKIDKVIQEVLDEMLGAGVQTQAKTQKSPKYQIGDVVVLKSQVLMEIQYGLACDGVIDVEGGWTDQKESLFVGKDRSVVIRGYAGNAYSVRLTDGTKCCFLISAGMIVGKQYKFLENVKGNTEVWGRQRDVNGRFFGYTPFGAIIETVRGDLVLCDKLY
jgi:hypothetical protein